MERHPAQEHVERDRFHLGAVASPPGEDRSSCCLVIEPGERLGGPDLKLKRLLRLHEPKQELTNLGVASQTEELDLFDAFGNGQRRVQDTDTRLDHRAVLSCRVLNAEARSHT